MGFVGSALDVEFPNSAPDVDFELHPIRSGDGTSGQPQRPAINVEALCPIRPGRLAEAARGRRTDAHLRLDEHPRIDSLLRRTNRE